MARSAKQVRKKEVLVISLKKIKEIMLLSIYITIIFLIYILPGINIIETELISNSRS